jgi:hypothetical protein
MDGYVRVLLLSAISCDLVDPVLPHPRTIHENHTKNHELKGLLPFMKEIEGVYSDLGRAVFCQF